MKADKEALVSSGDMNGEKPSHTPGPWHVLPKLRAGFTDHGYRLIAVIERGTAVPPLCIYGEAKNMWQEGRGCVWGDSEADANVLAAAPEMLAALCELTDAADFAWNGQHAAIAKARAAIAKATGSAA